MRRVLLALGLMLAWTVDASAQNPDGRDWYIFKPPWEQTNQMVCTEIRRDQCTLLGSCGPSRGGAKLTFDFTSNRIEFGISLRGIPEIRITGRTYYPISKVDPTMALLVGDGRLFKLKYRLTDPNRGLAVLDSDGRLVARRSKDDVVAIEPMAELFGFMVGYQSWDLINKEDTLEVTRYECAKKNPGMFDSVKPLLDRLRP